MTNTATKLAKQIEQNAEDLKGLKVIMAEAGFSELKFVKDDVVVGRYADGITDENGQSKAGQTEYNQETVQQRVDDAISKLSNSKQTELIAGLSESRFAPSQPEMTANYNVDLTENVIAEQNVAKEQRKKQEQQEAEAAEQHLSTQPAPQDDDEDDMDMQVGVESVPDQSDVNNDLEDKAPTVENKQEDPAVPNTPAVEEEKLSPRMQALLTLLSAGGSQPQEILENFQATGFLDDLDTLEDGDDHIVFTQRKERKDSVTTATPVTQLQFKADPETGKPGTKLNIERTESGGLRITSSSKNFNQDTADKIIALKKASGSGIVSLVGPKKHKKMLWMAAQQQGLVVDENSFTPSEEDKQELAEWREANPKEAGVATPDPVDAAPELDPNAAAPQEDRDYVANHLSSLDLGSNFAFENIENPEEMESIRQGLSTAVENVKAALQDQNLPLTNGDLKDIIEQVREVPQDLNADSGQTVVSIVNIHKVAEEKFTKNMSPEPQAAQDSPAIATRFGASAPADQEPVAPARDVNAKQAPSAKVPNR